MPVSRDLPQPWMACQSPEWRVTVVRPGPDAGRTALDALDDRALALLAGKGGAEAFEVLVRRHQRTIYQVCYRFVRDHGEASDAMQDVFLRAWRALPRFKGEAAFATWLYRIAVNACLTRVASRRPATGALADAADVPDPHATPTSALLARERATRVRRAIGRLPARQRATVILRVFHDLPHADIAAALGTSVGAVKANFFHALRNLKRLLGEDRP